MTLSASSQSSSGVSLSRQFELVGQLVNRSSHGNAKLESLLPRVYGTLLAAVVSANGSRFVAWVTPDYDLVVVGALFGLDGENRTLAAMREAGVEPLAPTSSADARGEVPDMLLQAAARADGWIEGIRGPLVHAFIDLNCSFCSMLYSQLKPLILRGQLRVHWILVAVLAESSGAQAAAVLEARDPSAALAGHEARRTDGGSGIAGRPPSARTARALEANNRLLRLINQGVAATPVLLFRDRNGVATHHAGALQPSSDFLSALPSG
jgi:thiol:disulfide interchange protein DsbG